MWKLFKNDAFVTVFLALCPKCHNTSGLTFLLLLVVIYAVNVGLKTTLDGGKRMTINTRNYDGFCKCASWNLGVCFSVYTDFSDMFAFKSEEEKEKDRERLVCKYEMKLVPLVMVHFNFFYMANGHVWFKSVQWCVLGPFLAVSAG